MEDASSQKIRNIRLAQLQAKLQWRQYKVSVVEDGPGAVSLIEQLIPAGSIVGYGGSMTLRQTGIMDRLHKMDIHLLDRDSPDISPQEKQELCRQNLTADYFLCSANAISADGKIYNIDGAGSRMAAVIYGPRNVIMVVGTNKIVEDEAAADKRMKTIAAPYNCERLNRDTPCRSTGCCVDCMGPQRICAVYVRLDKCMEAGRIHVVIIKEGQWGY